ncbi:hypothetical protein BC351_37645 [Paenibacillus ferrarius]|uniref:HTH araC/xylS-type domain-containing protein n=1 Tax=Paenibacillus ferrarius TaxID=1469647 RepID=A0A1V4HAZ4_9BACL|nr:AraC family transcriptional regulator [Paenibacillus ferrarius]OPH49041.1 hypothetical protein BC351_37645 [Paenibacillus ferrarius]
MQITNNLLSYKLSDLRVKLISAKYSVCSTEWRKENFVPEYNKFYYICDGNGWIQVDGKLYCPQAGQLFFAPSGVVQSYAFSHGRPFTMFWCHFTANMGLSQLFRTIGIPPIMTVQDDATLLRYFQQLIDNRSNTQPTALLKIQSALLEMIAYYIDHAMIEVQDTGKFSSMNRLVATIQYIDENLDKELTIYELSQTANFHPNYFIRFFKTHLGVSPMRYIYDRRLEKAKELLIGYALSINEIANLTGFYDASHFSTSFKKHVGLSPSEYRNLEMASETLRPRVPF